MKLLPILVCLFLFTTGQGRAAVAAPPVVVENSVTETTSLNRADLEAQLGRKLKFTERIAFGMLKKKARKQQKAAAGDGKTDGLAVTSFVVGVASILLLFANGIGFLTAIVGLVLGIVALSRINRNPGFRSGKGLAIAGIAINGGLIFLTLLALAIVIAAFS